MLFGVFFLLKITLTYVTVSHLPAPSSIALLFHLALSHVPSDIPQAFQSCSLSVFDTAYGKAPGYRSRVSNSVQGEATGHTFLMHNTFGFTLLTEKELLQDSDDASISPTSYSP